MIVRDEAELDRARGERHCERCGRRQPGGDPLHPHHAFITRGAGGSDLRENLAGLCWYCHRLCHSERLAWHQVKETIAYREGRTVEEIRDWLNAVRNAPKEGPIPPRPWKVASNVAEV